jgi:mRNA-degrading endonuclease HigB of HigAB toxin-antitoxin module
MPFFGLVTKRQFGHQPKLARRAGDGLTTGLNGKGNAGGSLQAWYKTMEREVFHDFNSLRATFASADYVGGLTVFNIGGNKYRLIASIHYFPEESVHPSGFDSPGV